MKSVKDIQIKRKSDRTLSEKLKHSMILMFIVVKYVYPQ